MAGGDGTIVTKRLLIINGIERHGGRILIINYGLEIGDVGERLTFNRGRSCRTCLRLNIQYEERLKEWGQTFILD